MEQVGQVPCHCLLSPPPPLLHTAGTRSENRISDEPGDDLVNEDDGHDTGRKNGDGRKQSCSHRRKSSRQDIGN